MLYNVLVCSLCGCLCWWGMWFVKLVVPPSNLLSWYCVAFSVRRDGAMTKSNQEVLGKDGGVMGYDVVWWSVMEWGGVCWGSDVMDGSMLGVWWNGKGYDGGVLGVWWDGMGSNECVSGVWWNGMRSDRTWWGCVKEGWGLVGHDGVVWWDVMSVRW